MLYADFAPSNVLQTFTQSTQDPLPGLHPGDGGFVLSFCLWESFDPSSSTGNKRDRSSCARTALQVPGAKCETIDGIKGVQ